MLEFLTAVSALDIADTCIWRILSVSLSPFDAAHDSPMVDDRMEFTHDPIPSRVRLQPLYPSDSELHFIVTLY